MQLRLVTKVPVDRSDMVDDAPHRTGAGSSGQPG